MTDSSALRARRARLHRKGNHTICDPARRCEQLEQLDVVETFAAVTGRDEIPGRGPRGGQLWAAMTEGDDLGPMQLVLLDEACRIADRLDRLDSALTNKNTWLRFDVDDGGTVVVTVDGVLAESRQQATTLRALLSEIRMSIPKPTKSQDKTPAAPVPKEGGLSDLSARIKARRDATAG